MYIESSLPCVEFFTVSTGALLKEIKETKEGKGEMLWLKDLFSLAKQILKYRYLLIFIQWAKFCCQSQPLVSCERINT